MFCSTALKLWMQNKQWYHVGTLSSTALLFLSKADLAVTYSTDHISHITSIVHCDQRREKAENHHTAIVFSWPHVIISRDLFLCWIVGPFLGVSLCTRWQTLAQHLSDHEVTQQPHKVLVRHSLTTSSDRWRAQHKKGRGRGVTGLEVLLCVSTAASFR